MALGLSSFVFISCSVWHSARAVHLVPLGNLAPANEIGPVVLDPKYIRPNNNFQFYNGPVEALAPFSPFNVDEFLHKMAGAPAPGSAPTTSEEVNLNKVFRQQEGVPAPAPLQTKSDDLDLNQFSRKPEGAPAPITDQTKIDFQNNLFFFHPLFEGFKSRDIKPYSKDLQKIDWSLYGKEYKKLDHQQHVLLVEWLEQGDKKTRLSPGMISDLGWSLDRSAKEQPPWWGQNDINKWKKSNLDWKRMVQIGDLLELDRNNRRDQLGAKHLQQIENEFGPILKKAFADKKHDITKELQSLRQYQDSAWQHIYDQRVRQIQNHIQRRLNGPELSEKQKADLNELKKLMKKAIPQQENSKPGVTVLDTHFVSRHGPKAAPLVPADSLRVTNSPDGRVTTVEEIPPTTAFDRFAGYFGRRVGYKPVDQNSTP